MGRDYRIKWERGDFIRLGQAVSRFNKQINKLVNKENKKILPSYFNYEELKNKIYTRKNLNQIIKDLNRFSRGSENQIIEKENGIRLTKWEDKITKRQQRRAIKNLKKEIEPYKKEVKGSGGYSRASMGNVDYINLEKKLKEIENYNKVKDLDKYRRITKSIESIGNYDYQLKKATIFRNNYLKVITDYYRNFSNFDILMSKFEYLKDPFIFYEAIKNTEIINDLTLQSDQVMAQYEFDSFVREFGEEYFDELYEIIERKLGGNLGSEIQAKSNLTNKENQIISIYERMENRYLI